MRWLKKLPKPYIVCTFTFFRVLAKNRKNRKVDNFSGSLAIFRSLFSLIFAIFAKIAALLGALLTLFSTGFH